MPKYIPGVGPSSPDLVVVGEAPGKHENEEGLPFVGPTGKILDGCLFKAGLKRSQVYLTNVVKYQPPLNDFSKLHIIGVNLEDSIRELWENELRLLKPKCILAVGNEALKALTEFDGILQYRGSILTARDGVTKVVPTVHPAALFSHSQGQGDEYESKGGLAWTYLKLIEADIIRAVEESKTRELILPHRDLVVAHSSLDLFRYFREYEKFEICASDIESINCIPSCIGFAFNKHHAISVPLLRQIGKHKLTDMGDNEMDEVWRMVDEQLRRLKLIGHHFKYDEYKLNRIRFGGIRMHSDTLIKTRVVFPELPLKKLFVLSSLWTREPFYKDEGSEFKLGKHPIERHLLYCGKDCAVTKEVDEELETDLIELAETYGVPLVDYYYNYQMKKHAIYLKMENVGFMVDKARQKELNTKYKAMQMESHERLVTRIGHEINVKSYPNIFELLYREMKFKLRLKAPTSEDVIVSLLGSCKKKEYKEILLDVLEERRIRDQRSRQINFCPDYDGTCKSAYNVIATETCRSSTGILKKPIRPKKIGLAFHTISTHGRLAKDIKSMFVPRPGKVFVKGDASQAEPRIVAVLAEDWELLKAFDDKVDIHRRTAGLMFGYLQKLELSADFKHPIVDFLPKDGPERFTGKKIRNAGNYDMKKRRLMTEFNTDAQKFDINMSISEWRAGQMLDLFHSASPKLRSKFYRDIQECLMNTRCLIDSRGGVRIFNGRMDEELFKEGYANLPQREVAHIIQTAMIKIEEEVQDADAAYLIGEKHDELVMEVPGSDWMPYAQLLKKHIEVPIDFRTHCSLKRDYTLTIPCDVEVSATNLASFEKVKM